MHRTAVKMCHPYIPTPKNSIKEMAKDKHQDISSADYNLNALIEEGDITPKKEKVISQLPC